MGRKKTKPDKPQRFKYNVGDKLIYVGGLYANYTNQECEIVDRNKKYITEWYRIMFDDKKDILTILSTLKRKEEVIES